MARTLLRAGRVAVGGILAALVLGLILYTLTRAGRAQVDTGQPPPATAQEETGVDMAAFQRTADDLRRTCRYDDLYDLCVQTLEEPLDAKQVVRVGGELARLYIETQQVDLAEEVTGQLCVDYADQPEVVPVLCEIGDAWRSMRDFDRAKAVYERTVAEQGERPYAMWAQKNLCTLAIQRRREADARTAVESLVEQFGSHPQLPLALCMVGDAYLSRKDYAEALDVYHLAVERYADRADTIWAQKNICTTLLHKNVRNLEQAEAQTQRLIELFGDRPQAAQALCEVGDAWRSVGELDRAVGLYAYVIEQYPEAGHAFWSQKNLCTLYAEQGDETAADVAVETLLTRFAEHGAVPQVVCETGDAWRQAGRTDKALALYEYVIAHWPAHGHAVWSAKNIVTLHIDTGDFDAAAEALDWLAADFADREQLPQALLDIIDAYRGHGRVEEARHLCDYVVATFPAGRWALWARQKAILVDIALSEQAQPPPDTLPEPIARAVDALIADFATFPEVTFAVLMLGEDYLQRGTAECRCRVKQGAEHDMVKALEVLQRVTEGNLPVDRTATPDAWFLTGIAYAQLDQPDRAMPYFQEVTSAWPDYHLGWNAQEWLGLSYAMMGFKKKLAAEVADAAAGSAFEDVLTRYPDSPMREAAYWRLSLLAEKRKDWDRVAQYTEFWLNEGLRDGRRPGMLYQLGQAYEELGEQEMALGAYHQLMAEHPDEAEWTGKASERAARLEGGAQ